MEKGKVYLGGAGPGDERLCSIRCMQLIKRADVIVYDRLASKHLLSYAKENCELIDAGKGPKKHTLKQQEINKILLEKAEEGKKVVRLKGGDPFIFGRGAEEAEELKNNGIYFEIVPGISSFYSACAYAGIPVTYRNYASSFHVFTGHFQNDRQLDYKIIAQLEGTLLFLMGMNSLDKITKGLMEGGKDPNTSAAIIEWGTTRRQREVTGQLWNLKKLAEEKEFGHPAIIVIGDVVSVREKIAWQERRPLWGRKILLTRTAEASSEIVAILSEWGAEVEEFPLIQITPPEDWKQLDFCLDQIEDYTWLFFTSVNGVEFFFERMRQRKQDIRSLSGIKIFCIGERTKKYIEQKGIFVDKIPSHYHSIQAIAEMEQFIQKGDKICYPTSSLAGDQLCKRAVQLGAQCDEVIAYKNEKNRTIAEEKIKQIAEGEFDAILFASSSQVENFVEMTRGKAGGAKLCSIGSMTTKTAEKFGLCISVTAETSNALGLAEAAKKAVLE